MAMHSHQLRLREALVARNDSILDRWPDRTGEEFTHEMQSVSKGLDRLAREADASEGDLLERARTWRFVGNAYFDLGQGKEVGWLRQATNAFQRAETLLEGIGDSIEIMKLNYSHANAVFGLSEGTDLQLAYEAKRRFERALNIARNIMPAGVPQVERKLSKVDRMISLLELAENMGDQIADLEEKLESDPADSGSKSFPNPSSLFGILQNQFEAEKRKGTMTPGYESSLEGVMERLGSIVNAAQPNQPLPENIVDRDKMSDQMTDMLGRIRRTTFEGEGIEQGTRISQILSHLQAVKAFIGEEAIPTGKSEGESKSLIDLFRRLGHLTTYLSQTGGAKDKVVEIESLDARSLMNEVRLFARRRHLTLAQPVWSRRSVALDPNYIFFAGSDEVRGCFQSICKEMGLSLNPELPQGDDFTEARWQDLRRASVGAFDLSSQDPQLFHDLGIALTLGMEVMLIAKKGTPIPFDIAQDVKFYSGEADLQVLLLTELSATMYGLQTRGTPDTSLDSSLAYAGRLAERHPENSVLMSLLSHLQSVASDPVKFRAAIKVFNDRLDEDSHLILNPRWPGVYPDLHKTRCFIIMPFRNDLNVMYDVIAKECKASGIKLIRGDMADEQQIVLSIWEEIGKATHIIVDLTGFNLNVCLELGIANALGRNTFIIGRQGTEKELFRSIEKRRCHPYPSNPESDPNFMKALKNFLAD